MHQQKICQTECLVTAAWATCWRSTMSYNQDFFQLIVKWKSGQAGVSVQRNVTEGHKLGREQWLSTVLMGAGLVQATERKVKIATNMDVQVNRNILS